jgi:hypothetical protein
MILQRRTNDITSEIEKSKSIIFEKLYAEMSNIFDNLKRLGKDKELIENINDILNYELDIFGNRCIYRYEKITAKKKKGVKIKDFEPFKKMIVNDLNRHLKMKTIWEHLIRIAGHGFCSFATFNNYCDRLKKGKKIVHGNRSECGRKKLNDNAKD